MDTLSALVDATLAVEKIRVRTQVRQSHLRLQGRCDPETDVLLEKLQGIEGYIDGRVAVHIRDHPAYPWFHQVPGVGQENIGKVVGQVRVKPEKSTDKKGDVIDLPYADTISALWKFAGFSVEDGASPRREKGEKLSYNSQLRSMCWRLAVSLMKAGIRKKCSQCGAILGEKKIQEHECQNAQFPEIGVSEFGNYYLQEKRKYYQKYQNRGMQIVPTTSLPKDKNGKYYEPEGVLSEGHVHNQALRRMIKLFLACLWLTWREAEGLPVTKPYAIDKLGHDSFIDPWAMIG